MPEFSGTAKASSPQLRRAFSLTGAVVMSAGLVIGVGLFTVSTNAGNPNFSVPNQPGPESRQPKKVKTGQKFSKVADQSCRGFSFMCDALCFTLCFVKEGS